MSKFVKANNMALQLMFLIATIFLAIPALLGALYEAIVYQDIILVVIILPVYNIILNYQLFSGFLHKPANSAEFRRPIFLNFGVLLLGIVVSVVFAPIYIVFFVVFGLIIGFSIGLAVANPSSHQHKLGNGAGLGVIILLAVYGMVLFIILVLIALDNAF